MYTREQESLSILRNKIEASFAEMDDISRGIQPKELNPEYVRGKFNIADNTDLALDSFVSAEKLSRRLSHEVGEGLCSINRIRAMLGDREMTSEEVDAFKQGIL